MLINIAKMAHEFVKCSIYIFFFSQGYGGITFPGDVQEQGRCGSGGRGVVSMVGVG